MKTFHNGSYANCDVASHHGGYVQQYQHDERAGSSQAFHNGAEGLGLALGGPATPDPRGENRRPNCTLASPPLDFLFPGVWLDFLFS